MSLPHRIKAPMALVLQATFLFGTFPVRLARADERPEAPAAAATLTSEPSPKAPSPAATVDVQTAGSAARSVGGGPPQPTIPGLPQDSPITPTSLPGNGDKTGVSSQAISVPQGTGKVQGMGESFSTQMSTGAATFSVPFAMPDARGAAQPSLSLSYSSGGGHGLAGVGWDVGVPFIARQTDRGLPKYDDRPAWHPNQDRFVFNGGQELVPICLVSGATCANAISGEVMPAWADGYQYFRARVEGSYLRFFWSADHRTWRVQSKSGEDMELGVPLDNPGEAGALESDPQNANKIFRWNLARQYDAQRDGSGLPVNIVAYRYFPFGGVAYLTDIYDTPPAASASSAQVSTYAHHTRIVYEPRPDTTFSFRRGWRVDQTQRIARVDVASKITGGLTAPRHLLRRYHLAYDANYHVSLLTSVQLEGRCSGDEASAPAESNTGDLPNVTGCERLPPMTFDYQHVAPFKTDGSQGVADLAGYEGFDERITTMAQSPNYSVDDELADLFDINSDGLPDILVTAPGYFGGKHGVFFNGAGGRKDSFGASTIGVAGVLGADASTITLKNLNVQASDIDGDGTIDLLHMPRVRSYSVYTPKLNGTEWIWQGRVVNTADQQDPRIDFGNDTPDIHALDANGDGLVDLVRLTGTQIQTFFALGRYPNGDAQYGSATWASATTSNISNLPVSMCVPWAGTPARFSDSDIKLGDMNGDGLADIVRVHQGDIRYWPGRGNGLWGTGALDDCPGGSFGQGRDVAMSDSPQYSDPNGSGLRLDDVNGDGLDDLIQVRFSDVDVWLNVDGTGWTHSRHVIAGTPPSPGFANRVRLVDMNGSGTRDILWGSGGGYKYIDLAGGQRPWILTHVANGLGKTTDIEYASSTDLMLAAEAAGKGWTSKAPMPIHVVSRVTEKDNLAIVGRPAGAYVTEYTYDNPVYDGRQREFRGFRNARAKRIGDTNSPTATTSSTFLLGECVDEPADPPPGGLTSRCTPDGRWVDNPREALKGLPVASETFDESGVYLSTVHHTYTLRKLYAGLDGREVRVAFESASDSWAYDTAPFVSGVSAAGVADVQLELRGVGGPMDPDSLPAIGATLRSGAGRAHTRSETTLVDAFGNATTHIARGCVDGCPDRDEAITTSTVPQVIPQTPPGGWLWRTVQASVQGERDPAPRNLTTTTYDSVGNATQTAVLLAGTLPLERFHESGRDVASTPASASTDGTITLSTQTYDPFGNLSMQTARNKRCRSITYATDFADLPSSETVFAGFASGSCGGLMLTATATFDRGLGAVARVADLHGEPTVVAYDGYGRLVSLTKPSPTDPTQTSVVPSVLIDYDLATPQRPFSIVHTRTQDGPTHLVTSYRNAFAYADGFGRGIVTFDQADPSAGDRGQWIVNGLTEYDNKGAARRAYLAWFWDGDPQHYPIGMQPTTSYGRQRYDAFGRQVQTFGLDGMVTLQTAYHALSVDKWDAADLQPGPHQGTYASARQDGHGRAVSLTERIHVGGAIEKRETRTQYLSTGEPIVITRARGGDTVVRWLRYDSLGRMVLNVEPNTTKGFIGSDPGRLPATMRAWRYAYNDNGDLVGTSDARGCGSNYHYDAAGRLLVEDYSPCLDSHARYSLPDLSAGSIGVGAEVFNRYDMADTDAPATADFPIDTTLLHGRLVSVSDRASKTLTRFDGRGRATGIARRIAKPGVPDDNPTNRYAPRWYTQTAEYDGADRPIKQSTGAESPEPAPGVIPPLLGANGESFVTTDYTKRGTVRTVGSSYDPDPIVASVTRDADGLVEQIIYGDAAKTTTEMSYDLRRRLSSVQTYRGPPAVWSQQPAAYSPAPDPNGPPNTFQRLLTDLDYSYDVVDNPTEIRDWRDPTEWPPGAKPVTRKMQYDDLYRVTRIAYQYAAGDDTWVSPFAAENSPDPALHDPRRATPSPHLSFAKRVLSQSFQYDWLGNTTNTDDDAKGFYDRSLGAIANGTAGAGPYQLQGASGGAAPRDGALTTKYDDAGSLVGLVLVRNAGAPCLPSGDACSQRFVYDWDEVGRLARARRWDGSSLGAPGDPSPDSTPAVDLRYTYDATDDRTLKTAVDPQGNQLHTVYVFDSLELRRAHFDGTEFERTAFTESAYLFAHGERLARLYYATNDVPTLTSGNLHILLELQDHMGSSALVIDFLTSELAEATTYQPFGGTESDYRPSRWEGYRDDFRFTGKEEDVEVGLLFFGKRYLAALLGRWISADPLAVHVRQGDANSYAYVSGQLLRTVDPTGLAGEDSQRRPQPGTPEYDALKKYKTPTRGAQGWMSCTDDGCKAGHGRAVPKGSAPPATAPAPTAPAPTAAPAGSGPNDATPPAASGSAGSGPKGEPSSDLDKAVRVISHIDPGTWFGGEAEGGKPGGVPGGSCSTCSGSKLGQGAYMIVAIVGVLNLARSLTSIMRGIAAKAIAKIAVKEAVKEAPAANRAAFEVYKQSLRAAMERPHVVDAELNTLMGELYRKGATVGSGSTAAAVRAEAATGVRVGGKLHAQKAAESVTRLQKWLTRNPTAAAGDRAAAESVLRDLQDALAGR